MRILHFRRGRVKGNRRLVAGSDPQEDEAGDRNRQDVCDPDDADRQPEIRHEKRDEQEKARKREEEKARKAKEAAEAKKREQEAMGFGFLFGDEYFK